MAITQERMLKLVAAGFDWRDGLEAAAKAGQRLSQELAEGQTSAAGAFAALAALVDPRSALRDPVQSTLALEIERKHFAQASRKNDWNRQDKQAKRRAAGAREYKQDERHRELPQVQTPDPGSALPGLSPEAQAELERFRAGQAVDEPESVRAGRKLGLDLAGEEDR